MDKSKFQFPIYLVKCPQIQTEYLALTEVSAWNQMLYYAAQKEEVRPKLKKGLWAKVLRWILEIMSNRIDTMDSQQRVW